MLRALLFVAAASTSAVAQVKLEFPSCNGCRLTQAVQLANGNRLLIGTTQTSNSVPSLSQSQHIVIISPDQDRPRTILGGSGNAFPNAASVDPKGNLWIVGNTDSDDFDLVNPIASQKVPYRTAAFVMELDPTVMKLIFSTYLGGHQPCDVSVTCGSYATAIAFDSSGNAYVGGATDESDFPTTPGAYLGGKARPGTFAFFGNSFTYSYLTKISPVGGLIYSTELITGTGNCEGSGCLKFGVGSTSAGVGGLFVDSTDSAVVGGLIGGYDRFYNAFVNVGYVLRVAPDGSSLAWSTRLPISNGLTNEIEIAKLLMAAELGSDARGMTVYTGNVNLFGVYQRSGVFAAQLKADGSGLNYSLDLGQAADADVTGIAAAASGKVYLAGTQNHSNFIVALDSAGSQTQHLQFPEGVITAGPFLSTNNSLMLPGAQNSLLTMPANYQMDSPAIVAFANSASLVTNTGLNPGALITLWGFDLPQSAQAVQVSIGGTAAPILFASPTQINVQVPFQLSNGQMQVALPSSTISISPPFTRSLGIFTTDGIHAATLNQDGTANSSDNPAASGSTISLFGTGAIWPSGLQNGAIATSAVALDQDVNQMQAFDWNDGPLNTPYVGAAIGMINGVFQLNVQLPPNKPVKGSPATLIIRGGGLSSNAVQVYIQ